MFFVYLDKLDYFKNIQLLGDYDFLDSQAFHDLQKDLVDKNLCRDILDLRHTTVEIC